MTRYDLQALFAADPGPRRQALASPEFPGGQLTTGLDKVAQRLVVRFLTRTGSRPEDPDYGTDFVTDFRRGALRSEIDVALSFHLAAGRILAALRRLERADDPGAERLRGLDLDGVWFEGDRLRLAVRLTTAAAQSATVDVAVGGN